MPAGVGPLRPRRAGRDAARAAVGRAWRRGGTLTFIVTSASGANGDGFGGVLAFTPDGRPLGAFATDARLADPRGLSFDRDQALLYVNSGADRILALDATGQVVGDSGLIAGLNPGGGTFGPDGRYYVGLRTARSIMAFDKPLDTPGELILPPRVVPFPRGFAFDAAGRLFLASGVGPDGEGDDTIVAFDPRLARDPSWRVDDPEVSPLDLAIAPNGNIVVSSEWPFGAPDATTTIREYAAADGRLVRVMRPRDVDFRTPRGLRFGPRGRLYCTARDEVAAFDFETGECLGAAVRWPRLAGQALVILPDAIDERSEDG